MENIERLTETVTVRLTPEQLAAAEAIAKREERKLADVLRRLFVAGLKQSQRKR